MGVAKLADAATMGGYPKIACVIEEDLWRIGQARPGDRFRFDMIDWPQARDIERDTAVDLTIAKRSLQQARALQEGWN